MTEQQYKELQKWCASHYNKGTEEYKNKVALRNAATSIRRNIIFYKKKIKDAMFVLEACKEKEKINKWTIYINEYKDARDLLMKKFEQL
jgi:hypothetical protein